MKREFSAVTLAALALIVWASHLRHTPYANYSFFADALLHGHLDVRYAGSYMDVFPFQGRHYVIEGPFPALLMLPLALVRGEEANQTFVSILAGTACVSLSWLLFVRLGVSRTARLWLCAFVLAGTDVWWCAMLGDVWFLAHVVALGCTLCALVELAGRRRGWLVGLLAVGAFESRFVLVLALPFFAYGLASGALAMPEARRRLHATGPALRSFALIVLAGFGIQAALNFAMWGTPANAGYELFYHWDPAGDPTGSPFQLKYVPYELYAFALRAPELVAWHQTTNFPYLKVNMEGVALTFTSPALVLAFLARAPRHLLVALWLTVGAILLAELTYYLDGWYQFGMRHALDFEAFLFVLMALGVRRRMPNWGMLLCTWSCLVGAWGVWYWDAFVRQID